MARTAIALGTVLDALISGASFCTGGVQFGVLASTALSITSLLLVTLVTSVAESMELPEVFSLGAQSK